MLRTPFSPGRVQERNHRQALPFHLSLKAVAANLLPMAIRLQIAHVEVIASVSCPFERQLPAVHLAAVHEWGVAERAPPCDDRRFPQAVLNNVVKRQDARLIGFGNPILAHAQHTIVAVQKVRLPRQYEMRLTERNNCYGETASLLRLLSDQRRCRHQDQTDDSKPHSITHIDSSQTVFSCSILGFSECRQPGPP